MSSELFVSTFESNAPRLSMLCLHGIESHGLRYVALAARLGSGVRVVAPDLRGHGRSLKVGPYLLEQHVADLRPILESMPPPVVLLGHSYGGLIAWELARAAPTSLSALILVDPAISVSSELAGASVTYDYSSVGHSWASEAEAFEEAVATRPASGIWSAALDVAVSLERGADGRVRPVVARDAVAAGWRQMTQPMRASDWSGPTLVIEAGREHGTFTRPHVLAALGTQLGPRLLHEVVDTSHTIPSDYPDELAAAVAPFLAGLESAAAASA